MNICFTFFYTHRLVRRMCVTGMLGLDLGNIWPVGLLTVHVALPFLQDILFRQSFLLLLKHSENSNMRIIFEKSNKNFSFFPLGTKYLKTKMATSIKREA